MRRNVAYIFRSIKPNRKKKKSDHKNHPGSNLELSNKSSSLVHWTSTSKNPATKTRKFEIVANSRETERKWTTGGPRGAVKKPTLSPCLCFFLEPCCGSTLFETQLGDFSRNFDWNAKRTWKRTSIGISRGRSIDDFSRGGPGGTVKGERGVYLWGSTVVCTSCAVCWRGERQINVTPSPFEQSFAQWPHTGDTGRLDCGVCDV